MENKIANWSYLKEVLNLHNFRFSKSLGQNFLVDKNILRRIVDASGADENCAVLEIGAGAGVLTFEMAKVAKKVVTVEIDRALLPILRQNLAEFENVTIISDDILKVDINALFAEHFDGQEVRVAANLPYYITTPIIMSLLEQAEPARNRASEADKDQTSRREAGEVRSVSAIKSLTVMVQKEVAARLSASPGSKDYGALSVAAQYHTRPTIVAEVSPRCFMPPPKVASTVIHLEVLPNKSVAVEDEKLFFALVRAAFGQRRKTLQNAVAGSSEIEIGKERIAAALIDMKKRPDLRGEMLSAEDFAALANLLNG